MSLHPHQPPPVPEATARVARAAFPAGNLSVRMREAFDALSQDEQFQALSPVRGRPAQAPGRLALVTIVQFAEHLSDRQAADAVRGRIDLTYLLSLDLTDPGFDHTVLSEFRQRLLGGEVDRLLLDPLLDRCRAVGLLTARGRRRTDSTHVLAAVRGLNRLELVRETRRQALDDLAERASTWLAAHADPAWVKRSTERRPSGMTVAGSWRRSGRRMHRDGCGPPLPSSRSAGRGSRMITTLTPACVGGRRRTGSRTHGLR